MGTARLVSIRGKRLTLLLSNCKPSASCRLFQRRSKTTGAVVKALSQSNNSPPSGNVERMRAKLAEREFFQSVLGASATKRDAKSFLSRFDHTQKKPGLKVESSLSNARVNLGALYRPNKAVANSPIFSFKPTDEQLERGDDTLNVALFKIHDPQTLDTNTLSGVAKTLAQLSKLGVRLVIVLEFEQRETSATSGALSDVYQYSKAFADVLDDFNDAGARLVDQSFAIDETSNDVSLSMQSILLSPLRKGAITVVPPLAHTVGSRAQIVSANSIVLALTKSLSSSTTASESPWPIEISLNRIIFLDSTGGIPDAENPSKTHVFVNLAQDLDDIRNGLQRTSSNDTSHKNDINKRYLESLETISKCLSELPPTASALLATPLEIALSMSQDPSESSTTGVSTRPTRNTLIHNILTDKPLVSSSLPLARLYGVRPTKGPKSSSTFFKNGMPVKIVPDPRDKQWSNPGIVGSPFCLESDPRIDLPKLVHLIEDSFGRKLNVENYLKRIENHVAGVIIVGDYEGGALLTWEKPLDRPDRPLVPYLDKFAVLRRCQGSGGVADIVFNAMVRQCFPEGVVWRSRRDNPVNKWYFERSNGTWKLPDSNWTMFWTGHEVELGEERLPTADTVERWKDYVNVCSKIQPSWADTNKPPE
jgi:amino-acid N-acetyltransferase